MLIFAFSQELWKQPLCEWLGFECANCNTRVSNTFITDNSAVWEQKQLWQQVLSACLDLMVTNGDGA